MSQPITDTAAPGSIQAGYKQLLARQRLFYIGLIILWLTVLLGWVLGNGNNLMSGPFGDTSIALGRLFGLLAGFSVLLQIFLMSRIPLVDKYFSLHEIVRLHRYNGYAATSFIALHIVCITAGYASLADVSLINQFKQLIQSYPHVFKALIAVILITVVIMTSIGNARKHMLYEVWYFIHLMTYAAVLLALLHQINIGSDLTGASWFQYFWLGLYVGIFGVLLYYRLIRTVVVNARHQFRIKEVVEEAEDIYSVYLSGKAVQNFTFEPGQYAGLRVLQPKYATQNHPYSFSAPPGNDTIRFTVNTRDGSFTRNLTSMKPGTRVILDGPRGSFTPKRARTKRVVLVAGGVGVAPYMSLLPALLQAGHHVTLLYATRTRAHQAFTASLHDLQLQLLHHFSMQHYVSRPNDNHKPQRIDKATLAPFVQPNTTFYICGPAAMVADLENALQTLGVSSDYIVTERFST